MKKYLLIAEKPSLMRDLKSCYQKHKNEIPYEIEFTSLVGHICQFATPDKYKEWSDLKWKEMDLPLIPQNWIIDIIPKSQDIYNDIYNKIKNNNYDGIIAAEDADREGNLIHYFVETRMKIKLPTFRIWLNEGLTDEKILKAYKNMVDFHSDSAQVNLTKAAILRGMKDWLEGMNFTIGYSVASGNTTHIGRVKAPTIKLVYDNSMSIDNFVPETHYEIKSVYDSEVEGVYIDENGPVSFKKKELAEEHIHDLPDTGKVLKFEKTQTKKYAPSLYNLTKIQADAGSIYGYSPDTTLALVQSLYETHKLVSYPRSECEYVTSDISKEFPKLLASIKDIPDLIDYFPLITKENVIKTMGMSSYVNDKAVAESSHTAIIPTGKKPNLSELSDDEYNIFYLICRRFFAIFCPPCIEEKIVLLVDCDGNIFKTNGKIIIDKGFHKVLQTKLKEQKLPDFKQGEIIQINKYYANEIVSKPPERLTDATLVTLMENVQKVVENKEKKTILKETKGIGTTATRSNIVAEIIKEGYVERKKKGKSNQLFITDKGIEYINGLKKYDFINPEFTADMENELKKVAKGEKSFVEDKKEFEKFITDTIKAFEETVTYAPKNFVADVLCNCPNCNGRIIENKMAYSCEKRCGITIWKNDKYLNKFGIKVNKTIAKNLLTGKKIGPYKMQTKKGEAQVKIKLKIDKSQKYITQYELEFQ